MCIPITRLLIIIFIFLSTHLVAQHTITGTLTDGTTNESLIGGYIKCTNSKDSTVYFGTSDYDGKFIVEHIINGAYSVEFTYIGYENLQRDIRISEDLNLGNIGLQFSSTALAEIEVTAIKERVRQKGDTTLYNADAYGTNPDATTEDLLQKMPGFVVTDGKMQVQGENITKILVNGKPFFGDDPDMALKNLPAEVIASIEVFEKSVEEDEEEGNENSGGDGAKTINIVLKEEFNNGVFGTLYGGYGTEDKYKVGGNISHFKDNRRINFLGQFNNINQQNFSSADLLGVSGNRGNGRSKQRGVSRKNFLVSKKGGINTTNAAGLNYQESFGKKMEISGSYFYNQSANVNEGFFKTTYFDTTLPSYEEERIDNSNNLNHRLNAKLRYRINEQNTFTYKPSMTIQQNNGFSEGGTNIFTNSSLNNTLSDILMTDFFAFDLRNQMSFTHRFNTKKRSLNISFRNRIKKSEGNQIAISNNLNAGGIDSTILDQQALLDNSQQSYGTSIRFTEPIGKRSKMTFTYAFDTEQNEAEILTYSFEKQAELYDVLEDNLSNQFANDYQSHKGQLGYQYRKRKLNIDIRGSFQAANLVNNQLFPLEIDTDKQFKNFLPFANIRYRISKEKNIRFSYRTRINLPKANDLQSVIDISNPLRISAGNSNLNQQVNNSFDIKYSSSNKEKGTVFFAYWKSSFLTDYIGKDIIIASDADTIRGIALRRGAQFRTPTNLSGYRYNRLFITYGVPLLKLKSNLNFNIGLTQKKTPSKINGQALFTNTQNIKTGLVLSSNISEAIDFTLKTTTTFNLAQNTNLRKTKLLNQRTSAQINYIVANKWQIKTNVTHRYFNTFGAKPIDDFILWNASIGYKFLANNNGELSITLYDILKSNIAISQNYGEGFLTQRETSVLTQFFMLNFRYNIRGI